VERGGSWCRIGSFWKEEGPAIKGNEGAISIPENVNEEEDESGSTWGKKVREQKGIDLESQRRERSFILGEVCRNAKMMKEHSSLNRGDEGRGATKGDKGWTTAAGLKTSVGHY